MKTNFMLLAGLITLFFSNVTDSWATVCPIGKSDCGDNCCYVLTDDGGVDFSRVDETQPSYINGGPFKNSSITHVTIPEWVASVSYSAFEDSQLISVNLPPNIHLNDGAFATSSIQEIVISDTGTIDASGYAFYNVPSNVVIKCKGVLSECQNKLSQFFPNATYEAATANQCNDSGGYYYTGESCVRRPQSGTPITCASGYNISGDICVASQQPVSESDCYANGQVFYQNACVDEYPFSKKHWTPAEANQWLNDNDNTIIMTFKVNR